MDGTARDRMEFDLVGHGSPVAGREDVGSRPCSRVLFFAVCASMHTFADVGLWPWTCVQGGRWVGGWGRGLRMGVLFRA